jgi:lactobin A/cerein 7B family class IIb bacteriocin
MNTQEMNLVELAPAELENVDGGAAALATVLLFGAGAVVGAAVVIGGAYLIYRALS